MTDPKKKPPKLRYTYWQLLVFVIALSMLAFVTIRAPSWYNDYLLRAHLLSPDFQTTVRTDAAGDVWTDRHTFSAGSFGVTEIGHVRLALSGLPFSGHSSGGEYQLKGAPSQGTGSGSSGVGNRKFTDSTQNGVTTCTFGGITFTLKLNTLTVDGQDFDLMGRKTLILINRDKKIDRVEFLEE